MKHVSTFKDFLNESHSLSSDELIKKFTEETGISTWDDVKITSEPGIWTVVRLWAPKENGGMDAGLHIELTKGESRQHFQIMDEDGNLTILGQNLTKIVYT